MTDSELLAKMCPACGQEVLGRTLHQQFCEPCKTERKRESSRLASERRRRKAGVPAVKGQAFICEMCGSDFTATSKSRAKFCEACRPEAALARSRNWSASRISDPERRDHFNAWYREQRNRPEVRVSRHMTVLMARALNGKKAGRSWRDFVDYSLDDLVLHLERQFLPGMTWDNRSEWHIDHIVPKSSFQFHSAECEGFKAAWALTNLRPIWAKDNVRKQAKRIYLI